MREEIQEKIKNGHSLAKMQIKDNEIQEIMQKIEQSQPDLIALNLDENELTDDGACILAEHLLRFPKLQQLSLQRNKIGEKGVLSLFGLKKERDDLDIFFRGNQITSVSEMEEIKKAALSTSAFKKFR